jgi:hypothetical protein
MGIEDKSVLELINTNIIDPSGKIYLENLDSFSLPTVPESTERKLREFLEHKKIKIRSRYGIDLHLEVTLQEIFTTLDCKTVNLVGSGVWFFLGFDYLKLCCENIRLKNENKNLWECIDPILKAKLEKKFNNRPGDFDFRLSNDDLGIPYKILNLFAQKCSSSENFKKNIL